MIDLNIIKDDIENMKGLFSEEVENRLETALTLFDAEFFYDFLDNLKSITVDFYKKIPEADFNILENWYNNAAMFIDAGFLFNYKKEFIPFDKFVDDRVIFVDGNSVHNVNLIHNSLLNGDLYFPLRINRIENFVFKETSYIRRVFLHKNFEYIGEGAFSESNIEEFYSYSNIINFISINLFRKCFSLEKVIFDKSVDCVGESAFYECNQLEYVLIGSEIQDIGSKAFMKCYSLSEFNFGNKLKNVFNEAFKEDFNLKDINLPKGTKKVYKEAFKGCTKGNVTIPCTCSFEKESFAGCPDFTPFIPVEND